VPASTLYPLAHLGRARAARLVNDMQTARKGYESMLAIWNEADPDLQPLKDARLELSELR